VKLIAGRGSGDEPRRPRPGRPGAVDVPGLRPGAGPNPGMSSRWRTNIAAANRHQARDPQRTLKLLQTA